MEYSQETMELLEGVLGDAISKQKNRASYAYNKRKQLKNLENFAKNYFNYKDEENDKIQRKYSHKSSIGEEKANKAKEKLKNLGDSDWVNEKDKNMTSDYHDNLRKIFYDSKKYEDYKAKHEAACILIEALDTLLSE